MDISYYKKYEPIDGKWYITKELGSGSFGQVFEIQRKDFTDMKSALKVISIPPNQGEVQSFREENFDMDDKSVTSYFYGFVEEFINEFKLMAQLKGHSNIVSYEDHDVIKHENGIGWDIFIRMELLTPMNKYFIEKAPNRNDIIRLGIDICKALVHCQKYNIIHRDIKPSNIFVSDTGNFKLGDFGVARTLEKTPSGLSKKGTYTYMAPEVFKGESYGTNVDIYSLGIVMYKLLNNNLEPFRKDRTHADEENAMGLRIRGEKIPEPANADKRLAEIVLKACSYNPKDRYESPNQMISDLESAINNKAETINNYDKKRDVIANQTSDIPQEKTVSMYSNDMTENVLKAETSEDKEKLNMKYCRKCGTQIQEDQIFCSKCGTDNSNLANNYPELPMKWHKFICKIGLILAAILNFINSVLYLSGSIYVRNYANSEMKYDEIIHSIYNQYPSLHTLNIIFGIILVLIGVFCLFTRKKLKCFDKNALKIYYGLLTANILSSIFYMFVQSIIVGTFNGKNVGSIIGVLIVAGINIMYYNKRKQLFINDSENLFFHNGKIKVKYVAIGIGIILFIIAMAGLSFTSNNTENKHTNDVQSIGQAFELSDEYEGISIALDKVERFSSAILQETDKPSNDNEYIVLHFTVNNKSTEEFRMDEFFGEDKSLCDGKEVKHVDGLAMSGMLKKHFGESVWGTFKPNSTKTCTAVYEVNKNWSEFEFEFDYNEIASKGKQNSIRFKFLSTDIDDAELSNIESPHGISSIDDVKKIYSFNLNGTKYELPFKIQELLNAGWKIKNVDPNNQTLEAATYSEFEIEYGDQKIEIAIANSGENVIKLIDGEVISVKADQYSNADFVTSENYRIGDSYHNVYDKYGDDGPEKNNVNRLDYNFLKDLVADDRFSSINSKGNFSDELTIMWDENEKINTIKMELIMFN